MTVRTDIVPVAPPAVKPGNRPFGLSERMVAMRYLRAKKSQGGVGLIAGISFACIMLAIAAMIIIMSIMNGFRSTLIELTIGTQGHVYVGTAEANPSEVTVAELERRLLAIPDVERAFRYTQDIAGIQANGQISAAQVIGMRPGDLADFTEISGNVIAGSLNGFGQGRGGENRVMIGAAMASQLGLAPGDRVTIYSGRTRTSIAGTTPVIKPYTIGGIFETGLYEADLTYLYMGLDQTSLLFHEGRQTGEVQVRLDNADQIDRVVPRIRDAMREPVYLQTWRDRSASLATALRTEQVAMRLIFIIVVLIATFPVLAAMIMLVTNKSRDIAVLRTIGATRQSILRIFLIAGATIGMLGTLVGLVIGVLFCLNIGAIQAFAEWLTGVELFPPDQYQLTNGIPAKIVWSEVIMVTLLGFILSAAATFWPAWTASKTDPVDALRYE